MGKYANQINRLEEVAEEFVMYRSPEQVMNLERLGSFHQTRLSFMRQLLRRVYSEGWKFSYEDWHLNEKGVGHIVFSVRTGKRIYSLIVFTHDLPPEKRSDRVIATEWDLTFTLFQGIPEMDDIERLEKSVPFQESGRVSDNELVLGRANRSVRLWDSVVASLSSGLQPSEDEITDVGYLMRTTAVYGSGKFGLADRETIEHLEEFEPPFQVELLAVYMLRSVVLDLVDWFAKIRGGEKAVRLKERSRKKIGIGNSTGLGMAPFLVHHPYLLHNWISAREEALTRVLNLESISKDDFEIFHNVLLRALFNSKKWISIDLEQQKRVRLLNLELEKIVKFCSIFDFQKSKGWGKFFAWIEGQFSLETQECIASLLLEPYSRFIDFLGSKMSSKGGQKLLSISNLDCNGLALIIESNFSWAIDVDYTQKANSARFWYVSQAKLEPRLGERYEENGSDLEQPLAVGRDIDAIYKKLMLEDENRLIPNFLMEFPEYRHVVQRIVSWQKRPYGEIMDNLISEKMRPLDMLRCKLSFFGATKFDPRSDRWVRICMYQNAPLAGSNSSSYDDFWPYPDSV